MHTLTHFLYACMHIIRCTVRLPSSLVKVNVCSKGYLCMHLCLLHCTLMLKERTTHVCIVQISHAHPPLAAAVFNCYQMYSKASHK